MKAEVMESLILLKDLERIPTPEEGVYRSFGEIMQQLLQMDKDFFCIEFAVGVEAAMAGLFDWRNVADDLQEAYQLSFANSNQSITEYYEDVVGRGEASAVGFISNLKGKLAELRIRDQLEEQFPGYTFSIAADPNQPVWDIRGISENDGAEILVQCKVGGESYAPEVIERMEESPGVLFAAGSEIQDSILSTHPELAGQFIETDIASLQLTAEVEEDLTTLAENSGVDVPDALGDMLPYVGEIVLGIRLIMDIVAVKRDFAAVDMEDRQKVHALKALMLFTRFGVTTFCTSLGSAVGSAVAPGLGTVLGSIGGTGLSVYLNKKVKPHTMDLAMKFMDVTEDDLFYFRNKESIDSVGVSLTNTHG